MIEDDDDVVTKLPVAYRLRHRLADIMAGRPPDEDAKPDPQGRPFLWEFFVKERDDG
ncbi:MAG TPA: hypothetical protein VHW66_21895 [Stellaceae bacterium]|jgi:hypothetical protein|nr:hypothetical protein [Stellaceae bacterium]